jgi:hypothetical protein
MLPLPGRTVLVIVAALALSGCKPLATPPGKSPLQPSQMSPDSVAVEIYFVRFPLGDADANVKLWNEIDEQHFPAELRQRLAKNGFRVGLIGGQVPEVLVKLMDLKDKPPPGNDVQQQTVADLEAARSPQARHLQMRAGHRSEIVASGVYEHLPVLVSEGGELRGQTYTQAQGILAMKAYPQSDGRVRLELVPELHHDQPRRRFVGEQAMMRLDTDRPKRIFDELTIPAVLSPGTMLVLGSLPNRSGSLGHDFFTEGEDNHLVQKLLVLRLCQTQHDDLIAPPPLLPEE